MGPKRKYQESEPQETVHASRQFQVYGSNPKPAKKSRRYEPAIKKQAHASSVNTIKKRIRDVTRRLDRAEDLPANLRIEDERALAAYQQELAAADAEKTRQKMIKKYHMVRFFERQKATRHFKKLRKRLLDTESSDEVAMLKEQMHVAEVDLNYTQYYPLSEPYISLFPQKSSTSDGEERLKMSHAGPKPPMWTEVEKCTEDGTLDQLRNRVSNSKAITSNKSERKPPKPKPQASTAERVGLNRRQRRGQMIKDSGRTKNKSMAFEKNRAFGASQAVREYGADDPDDGAESDGGFFQE